MIKVDVCRLYLMFWSLLTVYKKEFDGYLLHTESNLMIIVATINNNFKDKRSHIFKEAPPFDV